ncbi:hypothetical protein I203_108118 [Kwoniella mangroviensis CBS 8507]|uniref:hypothetical protein n=1 Tax=Kwoniella mangroviensis CBS 8507 TaxID=1296122 RepID=UPI00080D34EC|nr:uncharacterized protein I203_05012 [Kwoniella mangroviensis CBS 8507]OCF65990.1 hypothetical protein I203_05012 [Kwoniella mangroviensis CBS 8507]
MSKINVGLFGFTGTVGSAVLSPLIDAHKDDKINLIILHRESSDLSKIPSNANVEKRLVYLDESGVEKTKSAVGDLDVVISTVSGGGIASQTYLVKSLEGSQKLKTFIPSDFGVNWTKKEYETPSLAPIAQKEDIVKLAKESNVPTTSVRVGIFDLFFLGYKFLGTDVKNNKVEVYRDALKYQLRITSLGYLGYALSQLVQSPSKIANKTITLYDYAPTGQEIVDILSKINNKPADVVEYTDERYEEDQKDTFAAIAAGIRKRWGTNEWNNEEGQVEKVEVEGWKGESLGELVKRYA